MVPRMGRVVGEGRDGRGRGAASSGGARRGAGFRGGARRRYGGARRGATRLLAPPPLKRRGATGAREGRGGARNGLDKEAGNDRPEILEVDFTGV
jgi:hypothetical protein